MPLISSYLTLLLFSTLFKSFPLIKADFVDIRGEPKSKPTELNQVEKDRCFEFFQSNVEKYTEFVKAEGTKRASEEDDSEPEVPEILPGVIRVIAHALTGNLTGITEESIGFIPYESQKEISSVLSLITTQFKRVAPINNRNKPLESRPGVLDPFPISKVNVPNVEKLVKTPTVELIEPLKPAEEIKSEERTPPRQNVSNPEEVVKKLETASTTILPPTITTEDEYDYDEVTSSTTPRDVLDNIRVILFPEMMVRNEPSPNKTNIV